MKTIYYAVIPLIFLALLGVLLGSDFGGVSIDYLRYDAVDRDFDKKTIVFEVDTVKFGLTFIIGIITLSALVGIQIIGSGLVDSSVRTIILIVFYIGIWTICSVLSLDLLFLNKIVGSVIYIFLCFIYIIGVSEKLSGSG